MKTNIYKFHIPTWVCEIFNQTMWNAYANRYTQRRARLLNRQAVNVPYSAKNAYKYVHIQTPMLSLINYFVHRKLKKITGTDFESEFTTITHLLPGNHAKLHRCKDKGNGNFPRYTAILCTKNCLEGGEFVYNSRPTLVDKTGNNVEVKRHENIVVKMKKGDFIIFKNAIGVNGISEVCEGEMLFATFYSNL